MVESKFKVFYNGGAITIIASSIADAKSWVESHYQVSVIGVLPA